MLQEHPLVLGSIGLAIGAALGAGLPPTRREDELMGEKRDELLEQAKETGREQLDKAKRIAAATQEATQEEAQRSDLVSETAKEREQIATSPSQVEEQTHRSDIFRS
jgi:hypothetical protein